MDSKFVLLLPFILLVLPTCLCQEGWQSAPNLNDVNSKNLDNEYVIIKIPIKEVQHLRHKRFIGGLISGISAFVVKSGIWSAFKFSCLEMLKYTGGAILGEIYDRFHTQRKRRSTDVVEFIDSSDFARGCDSNFRCYNNDINVTQKKVINQFSHVTRTKCSSHGIINIQFDDPYLPVKFYNHPFRDVCFMEELFCLIILDSMIVDKSDSIVGCGTCPTLTLELHLAYFNISTQYEVLFCQRLKAELFPFISDIPKGQSYVLFNQLKQAMLEHLRPTPAVFEQKVKRVVAILPNENLQNFEFILN